MIGRPLSRLLRDAGIPYAVRGLDPLVRSVTIDSRRSKPGTLFLALPGEHVDGARFAADAVARGAVAVVAQSAAPVPAFDVPWIRVDNARSAAARVARECWGRPDAALTLVGITGTNGKTTVAHMVESIATAAGRSAGRIGTVGHAFAGREIATERTTPEAPEFYELLAEMVRAGVRIVAIEVSSHALALSRVEGASFRVAAFLNLGRDHIDFHGDLERYFDAKARLFETLADDATAVLAADDPRGRAMQARTHARVLTFGRAAWADVRLEGETVGAAGSTARLVLPGESFEIRTRLAGRFNLLNAAAAAACAVSLGLDAASIRAGIERLAVVRGRLEPVRAGQPFSVFVDFAHTEQALAAVLAAARELATGRLAVVFGCGGDRDRGKRAAMGRVAAERADFAVLTSDNPRGEDPLEILHEVERGFVSIAGASDRYVLEPDRRAALSRAIHWAGPGDVVVVAGKGHEATQTFAHGVEPFDDVLELRRSLAALGWAD
jgi:UDP-N-acetylmuramoyl-L-alanyl-D-glutamate--2,6-diaminopimelate ligase